MHGIDVESVWKRYGDVEALDGLSLSVEAGEAVGVFGINGAGKTTLFELLAGLNRPDEGAVRVAGRDPTESRVRELVRYPPEHAGFPPNLTGREVLRFHARVRRVEDRAHHVERALRTVGLADAADRRVGGYSNGMTRRLGLWTALVGSAVGPGRVDAVVATVVELGVYLVPLVAVAVGPPQSSAPTSAGRWNYCSRCRSPAGGCSPGDWLAGRRCSAARCCSASSPGVCCWR